MNVCFKYLFYLLEKNLDGGSAAIREFGLIVYLCIFRVSSVPSVTIIDISNTEEAIH